MSRARDPKSAKAPHGASPPPLFKYPAEKITLGPSPSEHLRLLIELLRPASPDLCRRLIAALLITPESDRPRFVLEAERKAASLARQAPPAAFDQEFHVAGEPLQRDGYVEQVIVTYAKAPNPGESSAARQEKRASPAKRTRRSGNRSA